MNKEMIDGLIRTHGVTVPKQQHVKIYFSDMDKLTHDLHKAFIQAQIKLLQELKGEREWLRDAYSDRTCYAVETREFDKRIVHLTKLLEDE